MSVLYKEVLFPVVSGQEQRIQNLKDKTKEVLSLLGIERVGQRIAEITIGDTCYRVCQALGVDDAPIRLLSDKEGLLSHYRESTRNEDNSEFTGTEEAKTPTELASFSGQETKIKGKQAVPQEGYVFGLDEVAIALSHWDILLNSNVIRSQG